MDMESSPEDMSVLLQFAKFSRGFGLTYFDEFIKNCIGLENLDFFGRLAYPNQWQIRLTDPKIRESLIRKGRERIKNRSCWIYPLNKQEIRGFVHWLPNSVTNDQLKEYLQQYGNVLFVESQERTIQGQNVESDHRYFGLILPYGTIKEDLPHFLKINGFMCLVVIRGREPACYHCKEVGHLRAECPKYKSKLISHCNREPNTAPPRLRPRGRRHEKEKAEVGAETGRSEVSSSDDVSSERPPFSESITEQPLQESEDRQHAIETHGEAAARRTEDDFEESSRSETQTLYKLDIIQKIQQKFRKNFQQGLKDIEKEIFLAITAESQSAHTREQGQSTATEATCQSLHLKTEEVRSGMLSKKVYATEENTSLAEMGESDSSADIQETESVEIGPDLPTMLQVHDSKETIGTSKKTEEKPKYRQSTEPTAKDSTSQADAISPALQMLKDAKQAALEVPKDTHKKLGEFLLSIKAPEESSKDSTTKTVRKLTESAAKDFASNADTSPALQMIKKGEQAALEIVGDTHKKLGEFLLSIKVPEKPSKDYATDKAQKLTEDDGQELLNMLKNLEAMAIEPSSFKKIEANLYSQLSGESIDSESNITGEDVCFAKQMLEKTKENVTEMLQNTIKMLEEKVVEEVIKQDTQQNLSISRQTLEVTMGNVSEAIQNTFKNLEEKVIKREKQSQTTTEGAAERGAIPKITSSATQPYSTSDQQKQKILDRVFHEDDRKSEAAKAIKKLEEKVVEEVMKQDTQQTLSISQQTLSISQQTLDVTMENVSRTIQNTFKNLEEKVVRRAKKSQTTAESAAERGAIPKITSTATQPYSTSDQRKQKILERMRHEGDRKLEASKEIAQRASESQEEKVVKVAEQPENATEMTESKAFLTIAKIETQPGATFEQPKQGIDTAQPIREKDIEVAETGTSKIASRHSLGSEETFQTESDSEATRICKPGEGIEMTTTENAAERKESESNISKAVQNLDNLQTNVKKIFASFHDKTAHAETLTTLKQVEAEVMKMVQKTKNTWEKEH